MKGRIHAPAKAMTLLDIYPVGCVYISVNATSPETLFGGRWEQIKDVFLLASGDRYAAGATGGEETHTLTTDEMPRHDHAETLSIGGAGGSVDQYSAHLNTSYNPSADRAYVGNTGTNGANQPHNNMPPYLTVYIWKRTA
ncbi:MAG: hypothetical protein U0J65_05645 [Christensenellales bacterium]|nr:hypothetical protein [Christensenellales bacterium]